MNRERDPRRDARRLVIKIGSALVTADGAGLDRAAIAGWATDVAALLSRGRQVVLVSSGAVAEGMVRLGWSRRPHALHELQAAAAVGQMGLVGAWQSGFAAHGLVAAQVLLSHDDLADRRRYLNARSTLRTLLDLGVVPVVNENDTVATEEIRFGDNDALAAMVANLIEAELLVILTDTEGLYERDPRQDPQARLIQRADVDDPRLDAAAGPGHGRLGRGGMQSKLQAARIAARSGTDTVIAGGRRAGVLRTLLLEGGEVGSWLRARQEPLSARKRWLGGRLVPRGTLVLDDGAARVLRESGRSLLPVGVVEVEGDFRRGDLVRCVDRRGREIARGLVNYSAEEARRIRGRPSREILACLGYVDEPELIHRDNLVVTAGD